MLNRVIKLLIEERESSLPEYFFKLTPKETFQALCNIRPPKEASKELLFLQDEYLQEQAIDRGIVDVEKLAYKDNITLWQGDITRLKTDAIVNACNAQLLGCFQALHNCIDNTIHTNAGIQVRIDCNNIMKGKELPNSEVVVTLSYNLPSEFIFHTVGPIVKDGQITKQDKEDLKNCYINSLEKAKELGVKTIAFCAISTGVYGYPKIEASNLAVNTVKKWLKTNSDIRVIFNVYSNESRLIYENELQR